jgi:hypothetical protein
MKDREDDYLWFARDLRVPFSNNAAEQAIRMSKLRIKVSGCMRSMAGAEEFCALRSYLATAARHGTGALEALISAFQGRPWIRQPDRPARHQTPGGAAPASHRARHGRSRRCRRQRPGWDASGATVRLPPCPNGSKSQ